MSGHYLPLGTIAWGISLYFLFGNLEFLGKYDGLNGIPPIAFFGIALERGRDIYFLIWVVVARWRARGARNLLDSRPGRAMRALQGRRDDGRGDRRRHGRASRSSSFVYAALLASRLGLAVRALAALRQPDAVRPQHGHRVPVHGGASAAPAHVWGALRRRRRRHDRARTSCRTGCRGCSARAATSRSSCSASCWCCCCSTRATASGPFVDARCCRARRRAASTGPTRRARCRAQRRGRRTARSCSTCARCARSSAAWSPSTTSASTVKAGEILGLIGPNGAGKSTTFNLVTGVLPLTRGEVAVPRHAHRRLARAPDRRAGRRRTFQHVQLLAGMTVLENVALGAHLRGRASACCARAAPRPRRGGAAAAEAARAAASASASATHLYEQAGNLALGQQRIDGDRARARRRPGAAAARRAGRRPAL